MFSDITVRLKEVINEIEQDYYIDEFGVNSELSTALKDTEFEDQYIDAVMSLRETIGMFVDLYMDIERAG